MEFKKVEYKFNTAGNTINLVEGDNLKDLTSNLTNGTTISDSSTQPVIKLTYVNSGVEQVAYLPFLDSTGKVRRIIKTLINKTVQTEEMDYEVYKAQEKAYLKGNLKIAKINYKRDKTDANKKLVKVAKEALKVSKKERAVDYKSKVEVLTNNLKNEVRSFNSKTTHTNEESKRAFDTLVQIQKNEGLNITNDTPKITKIKVFNGVKKVAKAPFVFVKNHKKGVIAVAVAGVIGFTANHILNSKNKNGNNIANSTRQEQMTDNNDYNYNNNNNDYNYNDNNNTFTNDDSYYYEQDNVVVDYEAYRNYEQALASMEDCSYTYNEIVEGYTFILNADNPVYAGLSKAQLDEYIAAGDYLVELKCLGNDYHDCSVAAINAINNGVESSIEFLTEAGAYCGTSLIDYMTVGRKTHDILFEKYVNGQISSNELNSYDSSTFLGGIGEYTKLINQGRLSNQKTYK